LTKAHESPAHPTAPQLALGAIGGKEDDDVGDVSGLSDATERDSRAWVALRGHQERALWGERREPAGRGGRAAAGDVDDDVRAAVGGHLLDHLVGSLEGGDVGGYELVCGEVLGGVPSARLPARFSVWMLTALVMGR
jgi:hypothetical protein